MNLNRTNYFERVAGVDFSKLPKPLQEGHAFTTRVGEGLWPWAMYEKSETIQRTVDLYFEKMGAYLAQQDAPTAATKSKAAAKPKATKTAKVQPFSDKNMPKTQKALEEVYHNSRQQERDEAEPAHETKPAAKKKSATKKLQKPAKSAPNEPKRTKVKKHGNQNLRQPVSFFDGDLTLIRQFLSLTKGTVTRKRVGALHKRIEKAIVARKVRKTSPNAELLTDIAGMVKKAYAAMTSQNIESVGTLNFSNKSVVTRARAVADQVQIQSSVPLLSSFINLQGSRPEAKTVAALLKKMENQLSAAPNDDYAAALRAAVALLKDWKAGSIVRITQQQLSGLSGLLGLGCPGDECSCSAGK